MTIVRAIIWYGVPWVNYPPSGCYTPLKVALWQKSLYTLPKKGGILGEYRWLKKSRQISEIGGGFYIFEILGR